MLVPRHCGIGAYARDQVHELRAAGHEVTVLTAPDGHGDRTAELLGGKAFRVAARIGARFDRVIVHFQPALYYRPRAAPSKIATSLGLLWLVLRRRHTEVLVHEADVPVPWRPDYVVLRLALRLAPTLVFHTRAERAAVARAYRLPARGRVVEHRVRPSAGSAGCCSKTRRKETRKSRRRWRRCFNGSGRKQRCCSRGY